MGIVVWGFTPLPWREGNIRGGGNISHCEAHRQVLTTKQSGCFIKSRLTLDVGQYSCVWPIKNQE